MGLISRVSSRTYRCDMFSKNAALVANRNDSRQTEFTQHICGQKNTINQLGFSDFPVSLPSTKNHEQSILKLLQRLFICKPGVIPSDAYSALLFNRAAQN